MLNLKEVGGFSFHFIRVVGPKVELVIADIIVEDNTGEVNPDLSYYEGQVVVEKILVLKQRGPDIKAQRITAQEEAQRLQFSQLVLTNQFAGAWTCYTDTPKGIRTDHMVGYSQTISIE